MIEDTFYDRFCTIFPKCYTHLFMSPIHFDECIYIAEYVKLYLMREDISLLRHYNVPFDISLRDKIYASH